MTFAKYPVTGGGGGGGAGDIVGPASSTDNALAVWDGATGKLLKNSSVLVGNIVVGPASATDGVVVLFDGTTGKLIKNSSIVAANIVAGPASATDSAVVLFDGTTGKLVKNSTLSASTIVLTSGNQTVGGTKTFSSQVLAPTVNFTNSSNQMVFGSGLFKTTISAPGAPAADLTYTFPNIQAVSLTGTVSLLEAANQNFSGSGTIFSQTVRFDSSSPLFLGAFPNRIILSPGLQASPRTWLFPDLTVDPTFAALEGTQSFSGNKTFSGTLTVPATVNFTGLNSITKAGNFAHTLTTTATSNSTFPAGTQTLAAIGLAQTWSAIQTHSAAITFTGGTAANLSLWAASNVLRQRGGTSGWAVDNTSGNAIISATDAGAVTVGPSAFTGTHTFHAGTLSLNPTGTGSVDLLINSVSGTSNASGVYWRTAGSSRFIMICGQAYTAFGGGADTLSVLNTVNATILFGTQAGAWTFPLIHNITTGNLNSGRYTPTITETANLTSGNKGTVDGSFHYTRTGNTVTVSGRITGIIPTAAAPTQTGIRITLPISSNLTATSDALGVAAIIRTSATISNISGVVTANAANDQANIDWMANTTGSQELQVTLQYEVK